MSQKRVIVGTDDHGRPISRWADHELETASGYGHMEPAYEATVERRQATPDELAAAVARETPVDYLPAYVPVNRPDRRTSAQPERNSSAVTGEETPAEEGTMDEPTPAPVIHTTSTVSPLTALSDAAAIAHQKLEAVRVAQEAWEIAREALDHAMTECLTVIGSPAPPEVESAPETPSEALPAPTLAVVPERLAAQRSRTHEGQHAGQASARDRRAARVTEAVARHGGDRSAAAAELGMRLNAVTMVMKFAERRAEATA